MGCARSEFGGPNEAKESYTKLKSWTCDSVAYSSRTMKRILLTIFPTTNSDGEAAINFLRKTIIRKLFKQRICLAKQPSDGANLLQHLFGVVSFHSRNDLSQM